MQQMQSLPAVATGCLCQHSSHLCRVCTVMEAHTSQDRGVGMVSTQLQTAELTENKSESQAGNNYMTI